MERLKGLGITPVNKDILFSLYRDLKFPENKIADLERNGLIIRIKRNLYVVSKNVHHQEISSELVANHLYGPSYVSLETALAHYGLIPERVYTVRSASLKMHKRYDTPLGQFEYMKVPSNYFHIGVHQEIINNSYCFLIASPEKALCDLILCTNNLRLQSVKAMNEYLEENLRFDISALDMFRVTIVEECLKYGRKKIELTQLLKMLSKSMNKFTPKNVTLKEEFVDKVLPFKIKEDTENIYILDYTIPKSNNKNDFKMREQIVWSIYGKWQAMHKTKKRYNIALKNDILIRFEGISETVQKAARNYKYTMAMCAFDEVLQYAIEVKRDKPKKEVENQRRYKEMIIMNLHTTAFQPYFENIKMTVGVVRSDESKKIQYCISTIEQ